MTDNEIKEAMNYCCGNITWEDDAECTRDKCYQCALPEDRDGDTRWCRQWLIKDALDLINRQQSEIERLSLPILVMETEELSEKELLKSVKTGSLGVISACKCSIRRLDEQGVKSETIKEFAEKVKALFIPEDEVREEIDNLAKEMVGEYINET